MEVTGPRQSTASLADVAGWTVQAGRESGKAARSLSTTKYFADMAGLSDHDDPVTALAEATQGRRPDYGSVPRPAWHNAALAETSLNDATSDGAYASASMRSALQSLKDIPANLRPAGLEDALRGIDTTLDDALKCLTDGGSINARQGAVPILEDVAGTADELAFALGRLV